MKSICIPIFIGFVLLSCDKKELNPELFRQVGSSRSGLTFSNILTENDSINYFTYGYIYMGGGVSTSDLNNDGLPELFFTGNMVDNRLYLNLGGLKFKDITNDAGVSGDDRWMTGVTMADVNADGWMDIYVSVSGLSGNKRNLLYINQGTNEAGIPSFLEQAEKYQIADDGQSVQSTFFDYDLDGDLDLYVGNYPITHFLSPNTFYRQMMDNINPENSDHFYQNNGDNTFTDITQQAGLLNFGLTLSTTVGDFNQDGYPDIYISNDFASSDYFFLNQGDGTFQEKSRELTRHTSYYGMGVDVADFNNDGLLDIAQMDMTPEDNRRSKANMASMNPQGFQEMIDLDLHHQYMKNSLQINNGLNAKGDPIFSDIAYMAGIATTDWSWSSLFADLDNDGLKDLYITNGSRRDINNKDFFIDLKKGKGNFFGGIEVANKLEVIEEMPAEKIDNYAFRNNGDLTFSPANKPWGISYKGFSNGAAYVDLDRDGDLEIVVNNLDDEVVLFENLSREVNKNNFIELRLLGYESNVFGLGAKVQIEHDGKTQFQELTLSRGFQSSVEPLLHFGIGKSSVVDKIYIAWPDGKKQTIKNPVVNKLLDIKYSDATILSDTSKNINGSLFSEVTDSLQLEFRHVENDYDDYKVEVLLPHQNSKLGPGLATGDVNGDNLDDFYIGGAHGSSGALYIQQADGAFQKSNENLWDRDKEMEDTGAVFFDANEDGFMDLYVVSGGNEFIGEHISLQDRLYLNDGQGKFSKTEAVLPLMFTSGSCVVPYDFDDDGDEDLFVGGRLVPGHYPEPARSYLLKNEKVGNGGFVYKDVTEEIAPDLLKPGLVTSAVWSDFDNDKSTDLVVTGEWMPIMFFRNSAGKFENTTTAYGMEKAVGWWSSLISKDFDGDGDQDYVAGNLGLNYKYKATSEETFDIYLDDFDDNGKKDIVLGYYYDGTQFPVRGRQCSSEQIPAIKNKFKNYNDFAIASVSDIYTTAGLDAALHYQVTTFGSSYIENKGNGTFEIRLLPNEAQLSSVNGILIGDYNQDGNEDLLLAGNFYVSEIETPRNDASNGLILIGDGNGGFTPMASNKSGFFASKDTRAASKIRSKNGALVLLANNNDKLQFFKMN